jgi:hypothetical protein
MGLRPPCATGPPVALQPRSGLLQPRRRPPPSPRAGTSAQPRRPSCPARDHPLALLLVGRLTRAAPQHRQHLWHCAFRSGRYLLGEVVRGVLPDVGEQVRSEGCAALMASARLMASVWHRPGPRSSADPGRPESGARTRPPRRSPWARSSVFSRPIRLASADRVRFRSPPAEAALLPRQTHRHVHRRGLCAPPASPRAPPPEQPLCTAFRPSRPRSAPERRCPVASTPP